MLPEWFAKALLDSAAKPYTAAVISDDGDEECCFFDTLEEARLHLLESCDFSKEDRREIWRDGIFVETFLSPRTNPPT